MKLLLCVFLLMPFFANAQTYIKGNNLIEVPTTTATAAGTTTLTAASQTNQQFTGATTQTVVLPDATTLPVGRRFFISNRSSGVVTVNYNGGSNAQTMAAATETVFILISKATAAGTWDISYLGASGSGTTYTANQYGVALSSATNATLTILAPASTSTAVLLAQGASANPKWGEQLADSILRTGTNTSCSNFSVNLPFTSSNAETGFDTSMIGTNIMTAPATGLYLVTGYIQGTGGGASVINIRFCQNACDSGAHTYDIQNAISTDANRAQGSASRIIFLTAADTVSLRCATGSGSQNADAFSFQVMQLTPH